MNTMITNFLDQIGTLQPSTSFVIIALVAISCAFTAAGTIIAPRLAKRGDGHPDDAEVAEDQDTWTELMRQLR